MGDNLLFMFYIILYILRVRSSLSVVMQVLAWLIFVCSYVDYGFV